MRKLALAVLVLAAVACRDQPATPTGPTPSFRAVQGDRSEWTLQWVFPGLPADQAYPSGFWPCINGGHGEDVLWWGPDAYFFAKEVVTPSGNTTYNGYYTLGGDGIDHYVGVLSGDEWVSAPFAWNGKTEYHYLANGAFILEEGANEEFTNLRTGERVRILFQWTYHFAQDGSVVGNFKNGLAVSCHILTH